LAPKGVRAVIFVCGKLMGNSFPDVILL